jgi:hypothetical protein
VFLPQRTLQHGSDLPGVGECWEVGVALLRGATSSQGVLGDRDRTRGQHAIITIQRPFALRSRRTCAAELSLLLCNSLGEFLRPAVQKYRVNLVCC